MIEQIKQLRVSIDGLSQLTKELKPFPENPLMTGVTSKELVRCYDSLILAKAWLGKILGELAEKEFKIDLEKEYTFTIYKSPSDYEQVSYLGKNLPEDKKQLLYGQWLKDNTTPYANDGNRKTVEDIEPTADKGPSKKDFDPDSSKDKWGITHPVIQNIEYPDGCFWNLLNHIEKVDYLRQEINKCVDLLPWELLQKSNIEIQVNNCYTHLSEARFWLGWELSRLRDEN
jgi:hypothetical protein